MNLDQSAIFDRLPLSTTQRAELIRQWLDDNKENVAPVNNIAPTPFTTPEPTIWANEALVQQLQSDAMDVSVDEGEEVKE